MRKNTGQFYTIDQQQNNSSQQMIQTSNLFPKDLSSKSYLPSKLTSTNQEHETTMLENQNYTSFNNFQGPYDPLHRPNKLYISFKNNKLAEIEFRTIFGQFGKIKQAYICNKVNKKGFNFGFVSFFDPRVADHVANLKDLVKGETTFTINFIKFKPKYENRRLEINYLQKVDQNPEGFVPPYTRSFQQQGNKKIFIHFGKFIPRKRTVCSEALLMATRASTLWEINRAHRSVEIALYQFVTPRGTILKKGAILTNEPDRNEGFE